MNISNLQSGDKITGLYYGVFFSGRMKSFRYCYPSVSHIVELVIILDKPITVFNESRDYVLVNCKDGSPQYHGCEIWSIQQGKSFSMADRFERAECEPRFAVKLYQEMKAQAEDRKKAIEFRMQNYIHMMEFESRYIYSCNILIRRYTELIP